MKIIFTVFCWFYWFPFEQEIATKAIKFLALIIS